jgi:hypothetical protein
MDEFSTPESCYIAEVVRTAEEESRHEEQKLLCSLLRDITGNPFRPMAADPA